MIKKQSVQVLTLDQDENHRKIVKVNDVNSVSESRIDDHAKNYTEHNFEGMNNEMYNQLHQNPFLYNYQKSNIKVTSIEDFFVDSKLGEATLGSVFRTKDLTKEKKKRIIKKAFTNWKSDFIKNKDEVINKENDHLLVIGEVLATKFSILSFILLIFIFLIISFLIFKNGILWDNLAQKGWFQNLEQGINKAKALKWFNITSTFTLYQVIIAFFYGRFHNYVITDYMNMNSGIKSTYDRYKRSIEKGFKHKFRYSRRYYLKNNKYDPLSIAPLSIDKTSTGKYDLEDIQNLIDSFITKTANLKRKKFTLGTLRIITLFLAYSGGVATIGYLIYSMIVNLF